MPADLIVYAFVAAGLVFWLRSLLGTRHGEERSRPDPFPTSEHAGDGVVSTLEEISRVVTQADEIRALAKEPRKNYSIRGEKAEEGLLHIADADRHFDIHAFAEGAQDAFAAIVESFAEGDRETLEGLLAPDVYQAFEAAITEREKQGHTQVTDIHAIRRAEITEAALDGRQAVIAVHFTAEESSVTKDADGHVIAGNPDKTSEMQDLWVFGRNVKSRDPAWLVMETRGGFDGDNDRVPDSH